MPQTSRSNFKIFAAFFAMVTLTFFGCNGDDPVDEDPVDIDVVDTSNTEDIIRVGGELFSIPSPVQTAFLIKNTGAAYDNSLLNSHENAPNYSTKFQKALNLGVYGADLAYVTIYDETQNAVSYLTSVQYLADELGVTGAFDKEILERFRNNLGKKDSMLVLVSDAYRAGDAYLKNNDRTEVASLILAGGWIEALHFATKVAATDKNESVITRIGEQKTSLDNLIKLLSQYYNDEEISEFVDELTDLYHLFDEVTYTYTFEKPDTDPENKVTTINSKTVVSITDEQLTAITERIQEIRNQIVK